MKIQTLLAVPFSVASTWATETGVQTVSGGAAGENCGEAISALRMVAEPHSEAAASTP